MKNILSFIRRDYASIAIIMLVIVFQSCKEDTIIEHGFDAEQLAAGRIAGTWGSPSNIITPSDVPTAVFGEMRLLFTTNDEGYPDKFIAKGCPIVFSNGAGNWSISTNDNLINITLGEVVPVDEFKVSATGSSLIISFYMGWENTETGESGEGEFSATLRRL